MDEAARCDRIALVQKGKIIALDKLSAVLDKHGTETYAVRGEPLFPILKDLRAYPGTHYAFAFGREHHVVLRPDSGGPDKVLAYLQQRGHRNASIRRVDPNIEDVFIDLIHEQAND